MIRLSTSDAAFARDFAALVDARRESDADVARDVAVILRSVRDEGDAALKAFTLKLDRHDLDVGSSRVDLQACKLEYSIVSPK